VLLAVPHAETRAGWGDTAFNLLLGNLGKTAYAGDSNYGSGQCALTICSHSPAVKPFVGVGYRSLAFKAAAL